MSSTGSSLLGGVARVWARHRETLLRLAAVLLAVISLAWLSYETYRLVWQPVRIGSRAIHRGGIDLDIMRRLVAAWFEGRPVYAETHLATHPPAAYVLLWPLLGWLPAAGAKLLWGLTAAGGLAWLVRLTVRESGAEGPGERTLVALVPLSMYATGATIGNGQLTIHLLATITGGLLLLRNPRGGPGRGALGAALVLASLVKPTVSAPFFWIALFSARTVWPAALTAVAYLALTVFAASFQQSDLPGLVAAWLHRGADMAAGAGESNLHLWLTKVGLGNWGLPASLFALGLLGLWVHRRREADLWVLAGVTAVVARMWTYHRWYDDMLLLFPLLALFRVAKGTPPGDFLGPAAGVLFTLVLASTLAPGGLYLVPPSWAAAVTGVQSAVWLAAMAALVFAARRPVFNGSRRLGSEPA